MQGRRGEHQRSHSLVVASYLLGRILCLRCTGGPGARATPIVGMRAAVVQCTLPVSYATADHQRRCSAGGMTEHTDAVRIDHRM